MLGSNPGRRPEYAEAVRELAAAVVARGLAIVYGGAAVGAMGVLADAALTAGGEVVGVIPRSLGYFDLLLRFLDHAVDERFLRAEHRALLRHRSPGPLLDAMAAWTPPSVEKWVDAEGVPLDLPKP
jgi:predicted Rossmann-fold nucleotide-binding protein